MNTIYARSLRRSLAVLLFLSALPGYAAEPGAPDAGVAITAEGGLLYGRAEGYVQTPEGGTPGTSSRHRPTLHELNIDDAISYEGLLRAQWGSAEVFGGGQWLGWSRSATLSQSLVNHAVTFPAGARVRSQISLDGYRVGAGWTFGLFGKRLELTPRAEFALLDFSSRLSSGDLSARRSYTKGAVRLGIRSMWHLGAPLSIELDGGASLPLADTPQLAAVRGLVRWTLAPPSALIQPALFVGVGGEWIDYEDRQSFPNHLHVNLGPIVTGGLSFAFRVPDPRRWIGLR